MDNDKTGSIRPFTVDIISFNKSITNIDTENTESTDSQ